MFTICNVCGSEKSLDDVVVLECSLGFKHVVCKSCLVRWKKVLDELDSELRELKDGDD